LALIIETYPTFYKGNPNFPNHQKVQSYIFAIEILHRCMSPSRHCFFQALFDAHIFTQLDMMVFDDTELMLMFILYGHASGFKLKVDNRMRDLFLKWTKALVGRKGPTLMQWYQNAVRNTDIWSTLPKKTKKTVKSQRKVEPISRNGFNHGLWKRCHLKCERKK
jgi:hypothetical protein